MSGVQLPPEPQRKRPFGITVFQRVVSVYTDGWVAPYQIKKTLSNQGHESVRIRRCVSLWAGFAGWTFGRSACGVCAYACCDERNQHEGCYDDLCDLHMYSVDTLVKCAVNWSSEINVATSIVALWFQDPDRQYLGSAQLTFRPNDVCIGCEFNIGKPREPFLECYT